MHNCAIIFLLTFLAFWGGHSASINITDSFLAVTFFIASSVFGVFSLIYLIQKKTNSHEVAWTTLTLLVFLGWLVYGYRHGLDGEQSLSMAVKYFSGMILAVSFSIYARESKFLNTALWALLTIGGVYGSLCLFLLINRDRWHYLVDNGIATLFSNLNFLGNFFLIPVSIWPYLAAESRHPLIRAGAYLAGILSMLGLYLSNSRGGQLTGIAILGISFIYFQKNRLSGFLKLALIMSLAVAVSYFLPASTMKYLKLGEYSLSPPSLNIEKFVKEPMADSLGHRIKYWEKSWDFIQENPWEGSGPYSFIVLYKPFHTEFSHNAHNLMIQTTIDSGFIGLALLLTCLGVITFKLLRGLSQSDSPYICQFIILGLILLGTQAHYLIEYFWHIPFFLTIFILISTMIGAKGLKIDSRKAILVFHGALMIILIGTGGILAKNLYHYQNIIHYLIPRADLNEDTVELLESTKEDCPRCVQPYLELSKYYLNLHRNFPENANSIKKSTEELIRAKEINYTGEKYFEAWGDLLVEQGKTTEGLGAYIKARKLAPNDDDIKEKLEQLKSGIPIFLQ